MKNKNAFLVKLSNGGEVHIDGDEVQAVISGIKGGSIVRVKQGLLNPSFIISVTVDKERIERFKNETKHDDELSRERLARGLLPLRDIFEEILPKQLSQQRLSDSRPS